MHPALQTPLAQTCPHVRQLLGSVCTSTQLPPQSVDPAGQTHAVPLHTVVGAEQTAHVVPHALTSLATQGAPAEHWC